MRRIFVVITVTLALSFAVVTQASDKDYELFEQAMSRVVKTCQLEYVGNIADLPVTNQLEVALNLARELKQLRVSAEQKKALFADIEKKTGELMRAVPTGQSQTKRSAAGNLGRVSAAQQAYFDGLASTAQRELGLDVDAPELAIIFPKPMPFAKKVFVGATHSGNTVWYDASTKKYYVKNQLGQWVEFNDKYTGSNGKTHNTNNTPSPPHESGVVRASMEVDQEHFLIA